MNKGVYCLILHLDKGCKIRIGKRQASFPRRGYYCYVGSALNSLDKRIQRHKRSDKKKHWHIDYLLEKAKILGVKTIITSEKKECWLNGRVKSLKSSVVMEKFGSTDCKCDTHLHYFSKNPTRRLDTIARWT